MAPPNRIKAQMACLNCRRVWEAGAARVGLPRSKGEKQKYLQACPICRARVFYAGRDFKAPRKSDLKQWRKVAALLRAGFVFTRHNSHEQQPRATPKYLREAGEFLAEREEQVHDAPRRRAAECRAQKLTVEWRDAARAREWKRIEKQKRG